MIKKILFSILVVCVASLAFAADYENLLEKGEFFLQKGPAYAPDALRELESATRSSPQRAASDPRLINSLSKAYVKVQRFSEAYYWLAKLDASGNSNAEADGLKDYLLNEAGVGRFRLSSAFRVEALTASFVPTESTRLDVNSRKILEKLNRWLEKPFAITPAGLTLLVPEGEFIFNTSAPLGSDEKTSKKIEVWAGDELEQHIVARYPGGDEFLIMPGNRTIELSWPDTANASYKLLRTITDGKAVSVYEGTEAAFTDTALPVGTPIAYKLSTFGDTGELWAISEIEAMARPPVQDIWIEATLTDGLEVIISWSTDEGTLDQLILSRKSEEEDTVLFDLSGQDVVRHGEITDGPINIPPLGRAYSYKIEAWVNGEPGPATAQTIVNIPPEISRIESDAVSHSISGDQVVVEWQTQPRDGLAEGYEIYLKRDPKIPGELVGRVDAATAREYSYVLKKELDPDDEPMNWEYIVYPYIGDRYLIPNEYELLDRTLDEDDTYRQAAKKPGAKIPDLFINWKPFIDPALNAPGNVSRYKVHVNNRVFMASGLSQKELYNIQSELKSGGAKIIVEAVLKDGTLHKILTIDIAYERYRMGSDSDDNPLR